MNDELDEHLEIAGEDDGELTKELADTATIEQLLDSFIEEVSDMFSKTLDVSFGGNSVLTHLELGNFGQDVLELAHELRAELITQVANRAEEIVEQGVTLRKQVIEEG